MYNLHVDLDIVSLSFLVLYRKVSFLKYLERTDHACSLLLFCSLISSDICCVLAIVLIIMSIKLCCLSYSKCSSDQNMLRQKVPCGMATKNDGADQRITVTLDYNGEKKRYRSQGTDWAEHLHKLKSTISSKYGKTLNVDVHTIVNNVVICSCDQLANALSGKNKITLIIKVWLSAKNVPMRTFSQLCIQLIANVSHTYMHSGLL